MASVAGGALAPEADQINLRVPLPPALAHWTHGIEAAVARLQRDDVERVRTVRPVAVNDVCGVGHSGILVLSGMNARAYGGVLNRADDAPAGLRASRGGGEASLTFTEKRMRGPAAAVVSHQVVLLACPATTAIRGKPVLL